MGAVVLALCGAAGGIRAARAADAIAGVAVESSGVWLPLPPDEIEAPDRLAEPPLLGNAAIIGDVVGGRWTTARLIARARRGTFAMTAARIDARNAGVARRTILVSGFNGRVRVAAGRVVVRDAPVLLGEAAGFSRRLRRPLEPRSSAPEWEAPRSAASLGFDGTSLAVESARGPRGRAAWAAWALGGRDPEAREPIRAAGVAHRAARWEGAASVARGFGSIAGEWQGRTGTASLEALVSNERGPSILASATAEAAGSPLRFEARWRRRSGERRPVAAELTAEASVGRAGTARLAWRPWSASGSAFGDDGVVELDARWRSGVMPGAARFRLGRRGGEGTATAERYAVLDLPLAGERGRLVSLLASRRERGGPDARAIGTTVGVRTRLGWRGRASVVAQVDAARTRGSAALGGAAWSSAIAASGEETLTARGTGGVYVTVNGWLRAGPVALRVHARDGEDERGGRPLVATIWLEWSGSAMRSRPPGDAGSGG